MNINIHVNQKCQLYTMLNQLGEPFDETTPDGREVTAVCTLEDGKIISVQKAKKDGDKSTKVNHYMSIYYCL